MSIIVCLITAAKASNMSAGYIESTDRHGNKILYGDLGDCLIPPFPTISDFPQHARDVREMEMNPGDIIITGFPKTGSHWTSSMAHMLMQGTTDTYFQNNIRSFLDMSPLTPDTIDPADRPRLFTTHFKLHHLPRQVQEKQVKLIYLERNPKDTWVSLYNHVTHKDGLYTYEGSWDCFFDSMISSGMWYGSWFDFVLEWERDIKKGREAGVPISVFSYEDMKKDPVGQIENLDRFLGYNRGRELCEQISVACRFSTMKSTKQKEWRGRDSIEAGANPEIFYRKGEVGDWKNWFTVAQNEEFDRVFKDRMQGSELRYVFD